MRSRAIYVEISIRADLDAVRDASQDPVEHARWDLRFSKIVPSGGTGTGPVSFTYERRVPFHTVRGTGVSLGEIQPEWTGTTRTA